MVAKRTVKKVKRATTKRAKSTGTAKRAGVTKAKRAASSAKKKSVKKSSKNTLKNTAKNTAKKTSKKKTVKRSVASAGKRSATATKAVKRSPAKGAAKKTPSAVGSSGRKRAPVKLRAVTAKKRSSAPRAKIASKAVPAATSQDPIQFVEERAIPKTHLRAKQLRAFRDMLYRKRAELVGDVSRMSREALNPGGAAQGDRSAMPIHMADIGSDNWEIEFTLGLVQSERDLVVEIDDALKRIANKTYGVCLATHEPISDGRLLAKPWAKYCIEYARAREEGRAI